VAKIEVSIFGLGDSIASKIANELNEASGDLHSSALVGMGLLLFVVTGAVNIIARILIVRMTSRKPRRPVFGGIFARRTTHQAANDATPLPAQPKTNNRRANLINNIMTFALTACLLMTLLPLFLILGFITVRGALALDWNFFTQLPAPPGET